MKRSYAPPKVSACDRSWISSVVSIFVKSAELALSRYALPILVLYFTVSLIATLSSAQSQSSRIYGPQDQDVLLPQFTPLTRQKDAAALQEIQAFVTATGGTIWTGIQATGTWIPAGTSQEAGEPVTVTIAGSDDSRFDITTPTGIRSIRILGQYEQVLNPDGTRQSLPFLAARASFIEFPHLLASTLPTDNSMIIDDGLVTVAGQSLHRITIEEPLRSSGIPATIDNTSVSDFYFDPTTHLLIKSAVNVPISWHDRARYLKVLTYGKYQTVIGLTIPFAYSETFNGQPTWSLQFSAVSPLPSLAPSYFHF